MTDFKDDLKRNHVKSWAESDQSISNYIATNEEIITANPAVFSVWIKNYICESATREGDLRKAKNDLQTIVDRDASELADYVKTVERLNKEVERLKGINAGQPTQVILNLEEREKELEKENAALREKNEALVSDDTLRVGDTSRLLTSKQKLEEQNEQLKNENAVLKRDAKKLEIKPVVVHVTTETITHNTTENKVLQEKITIYEKALTMADNAFEILRRN
jgi:hypothetical protein